MTVRLLTIFIVVIISQYIHISLTILYASYISMKWGKKKTIKPSSSAIKLFYTTTKVFNLKVSQFLRPMTKIDSLHIQDLI